MLPFLCSIPWAGAFEVYGGTSDPSLWQAGGVLMTIRTDSISATGSFHAPIERAIEGWDQDVIPGSSFGTDWGDLNSTQRIGVNNGENEIAGSTLLQGDGCGDGDGFAITNLRGNEDAGIQLKEADIHIDPDCDWSGTHDWYDILDDAFRDDLFSIEHIVLHEMGHVVGLDHEHGVYEADVEILTDSPGAGTPSTPGEYTSYTGWPATMEGVISGGSVVGDDGYVERNYHVNEDDREGVRFLYPTSANSGTDLAVQSYTVPDDDTLVARNAATSRASCYEHMGERARPAPYHDFIQEGIDDGMGAGECVFPMETTLPDALPLYQGAPLDVSFSLLNLGDADETVEFELYLSASDSSWASAALLYAYDQDLNPGRPYEGDWEVVIPVTTTPGTYYILGVLDDEDALTESDETNNVGVWNQPIEVIELPGCTGCSHRTGAVDLVALLSSLGVVLAVRRRR